MRTPHEQQMDSIAKRIAEALHGQTLEDVAYVCAAVLSTAILQSPRERREELRRRVSVFIDETIEAHTPHDLN